MDINQIPIAEGTHGGIHARQCWTRVLNARIKKKARALFSVLIVKPVTSHVIRKFLNIDLIDSL